MYSASKFTLQAREARILSLVHDRPGLSVSALASLYGVSEKTMHHYLWGIEKKIKCKLRRVSGVYWQWGVETRLKEGG